MLTYNRFIGKLDDKNVKHFTSQLDYNIEDLTERVQKLYEILYKKDKNENYPLENLQDFFVEYFDQNREPRPYFKCNINTTDCLSEFNEVCKSLEFMADYLLLSLSNRRWNDTASHSILTNNNLTYVKKKEVLVESDIMSNKEILAEELAKQNSKIVSTRYEITKEDLEKYIDLKRLQESIDKLQDIVTKSENAVKELDKLDNKDGEDAQRLKALIRETGMILKYKKIIRELKSEQRFIKIQHLRPIMFKSISKGETHYDFNHDTGYYDSNDEYVEVSKNTIDLNNPMHIYHLLEYYIDLREQHYDDVHSDMRYILDALDQVLQSIDDKLHKHEKIILEMKINKYTNAQIIQHLQETLGYVCSEPNISTLWTTKIPKMISEAYKQSVEDWLFLHRLKGKYKKCTKCGQNKLATQKYFGKHPNTKDKLYPCCKSCR